MTVATAEPSASVEHADELPEGWSEAHLADILAQFESGSRPKGGVRGIATGVPSVGGEHLADHGGFRFDKIKYVPEDFFHRMKRGHIRQGDVLVVKDGATTGKVALVRADFPHPQAAVNEHVFICRPLAAIESSFLFWFLWSEGGQARILENFQGSTQGGINQSFSRNTLIPVAPLAEQRRILAKVEELLAQADMARERLARALVLLKHFRQSVLSSACSGRLTADWRNEHPEVESSTLPVDSRPAQRRRRAGRLWGAGVVPELTDEERAAVPPSWVWAKVGQLGTHPEDTVQVGPMSMQSRQFVDSGVPVLNVGCVQWGEFDESKLNYLPEDIASGFARYRISTDDILFTRSGTVGRCAIATDRQDGHLMTFHLLRVRLDQAKCLPRYLQCVFQGASHIRRQTDEAAIGSTRAGFNTRLLAGLDIPVPPLAEQTQIVANVRALFSLAFEIEASVAAATERAERLTQSILAKAFRGELVPTEAELARREGQDYEPASVLLERVRAEREASASSRTKKALKRSQEKPRRGS